MLLLNKGMRRDVHLYMSSFLLGYYNFGNFSCHGSVVNVENLKVHIYINNCLECQRALRSSFCGEALCPGIF